MATEKKINKPKINVINKPIEENKNIQKKGLNRNTIDKFYTKPQVAEHCSFLFKNYIPLTFTCLIIEPSAGNGVFIPYIKQLSPFRLFYDLEPEHKEIIKQDFLALDHDILKKNFRDIHIIGNPPFGRQASMAIKFIKKCCQFATTISFILPRSFKKDSMQRHFSPNYHLLFERDLAENSFLVNDKECDVPCVYQIWQLQDEPRPEVIKETPINFKFVDKNSQPDISFRRVGVYAGTISKDPTEIENKSSQSHYFIKFLNNKTVDENIALIKTIKFDLNNTVGPKSISKAELNKEFNKVLS
jgi:predicted RNA methylase